MAKTIVPRSAIVLYYLVYVFHRLFNRPLDSRKKLQKLLFLMEHLDLKKNIITKSQKLTGYEFKIWLYGPFSEKIYDDLKFLVKSKYLGETVVNYEETPLLPAEDIVLSGYDDDGEPRKIFYYVPLMEVNKFIEFMRTRDHLKKKVEIIVKNFGSKKPCEIEAIVNAMLKLTPLRKLEFWGLTVDEYLEKAANISKQKTDTSN